MDLEKKTQAVQKALEGLDVQYDSHRHELTPDMAMVNGFSIIWHDGAFSADEPDKVEVRLPEGTIMGHWPIDKLRELVTTVTDEDKEADG